MTVMFALLIKSSTYTEKQLEVMKQRLRSFGVEDIRHSLESFKLDENTPIDEDVIIIVRLLDLTNIALRRLTVNSRQLPPYMTIWEDGSCRQLIAARIPFRVLRQLRLQSEEASLVGVLSSLNQQDANTAKYTLQDLKSFEALRKGGSGSWAKCNIQKCFIKQASGRGRKKLLDEIKFYRSLPKSLDHRYLQLLFSDEKWPVISLGMFYREDPSLRDLLMNLEIEPSDVACILRRVVEFEYHEALKKYSTPTPDNYLSDVHYDRTWARLLMCLEIDNGLDGLIHAEELIINGERFPNIAAMIYQLESSPIAALRLKPGEVSPYIHGDTHLGNILYNVDQGEFCLVDPRGYPLCDIFYDLGKLGHSYHGGYDLIHEGRHRVAWNVSADGCIAQIDLEIMAPVLWKKYQELSQMMDDIIQEVLGAQERDIKLKVLFNEAIHFAAITPLHIHRGRMPSLVVPFYAIAARTLAQVLDILGIGLVSCQRLHGEALQKLATMRDRPWKYGD